MKNHYNNVNKLFTFDIIRLCKIGEIIHYTFIFLLLVTISSYFINKYYYKHILKLIKPENKKKITKLTLLRNFMLLFFDIVIILLSFFYIKKIGLLIPSIPSVLYKRFKPYTTLNYTVHIALVVFFIELLPRLKERIEIWNEDLADLEFGTLE